MISQPSKLPANPPCAPPLEGRAIGAMGQNQDLAATVHRHVPAGGIYQRCRFGGGVNGRLCTGAPCLRVSRSPLGGAGAPWSERRSRRAGDRRWRQGGCRRGPLGQLRLLRQRQPSIGPIWPVSPWATTRWNRKSWNCSPPRRRITFTVCAPPPRMRTGKRLSTPSRGRPPRLAPGNCSAVRSWPNGLTPGSPRPTEKAQRDRALRSIAEATAAACRQIGQMFGH